MQSYLSVNKIAGDITYIVLQAAKNQATPRNAALLSGQGDDGVYLCNRGRPPADQGIV